MTPFKKNQVKKLRERFRGFLPVICDIETAGVNPQKNALLEICFVLVHMDKDGFFTPGPLYFEHIEPFEGAELDACSLAFLKLDPFHPFRFAVSEKKALRHLFKPIQSALKANDCGRAVLVGHNAWFDLLFLNEAVKRTGISSPFHAFTCFDTATLAGLVYGQTVLSKAAEAAGIAFNPNEAHSAIYDAERTAELFCNILNHWEKTTLG